MADTFGLDMRALPEGWTPLEAVSVIECLDADGDTQLAIRYSAGLTVYKRLGMLHAAVIIDEQTILGHYRTIE